MIIAFCQLALILIGTHCGFRRITSRQLTPFSWPWRHQPSNRQNYMLILCYVNICDVINHGTVKTIIQLVTSYLTSLWLTGIGERQLHDNKTRQWKLFHDTLYNRLGNKFCYFPTCFIECHKIVLTVWSNLCSPMPFTLKDVMYDVTNCTIVLTIPQ